MKNWLDLGNYNALCDSCGRKFKATSLRKRWDGLMVCSEDFEQRHPQDLLRVQRERISVPWARPYPAEDTYTGYICSVYERWCKADQSTADCATVGWNAPASANEQSSSTVY